MPRVSFEKIVKSFGRVTVLKNLDLEIEDGEFVVLLGPSGCGKTTLLNLLAGLQDVSAGRIQIGDRDVTDLDPKDRGLAMVFQSYALYPTKTVRGNLKFGMAAARLDKSEQERRIAWAAKLLQIESLLDRKPSQLSGGQRQRVAIGRALVKQVGVFLFDEPLSNLDAKLRTETRLEIKRLHDETRSTVVYVTHDQVEAMTMATRIAIMDAGVIQQFDTPDAVYDKPANLFVAGFIGAPAMNRSTGRIAKAEGRVTVVLDDPKVPVDLAGYAFAETPRHGDEVVVGLRPEHFLPPGTNGAPIAAQFELPVQYTEKTGADATTYLRTDSGLLAVSIAPELSGRLKPGQKVPFSFPADKLHVFDAASGRRL
jgi:multiple sugar transport system ATP-binding protein